MNGSFEEVEGEYEVGWSWLKLQIQEGGMCSL
jgi:hypothetical protein